VDTQQRSQPGLAIVTGASKGIGRAIALALAQKGHPVACLARSQPELDLVVSEIRSLGVEATGLSTDVMVEESLISSIKSAQDQLGPVSVLVNNAGGSGPSSIDRMTAKAFHDVLWFNVTSAYTAIQACLPGFKANGGGAVLNISSAAGRLIQPHFSAYGAAKAALDHLTRQLAQDLGPRNIRVNAIAPGPIRTDALARVLTPELEKGMTSVIPLGRLGETEDIAHAALFLLSPESRYITGKILDVDGGMESNRWG
jgi:7-alpha-hydroxysteroid dehydrogenase